MDYMSYYRQTSTSQGESLILDSKITDANGDGTIDNVYLMGRKEPDGIVINDIRVTIRDGKTAQRYRIDLKINKGYDPKLFSGKFNDDDAEDVLISIDSGNTGREGYFYIYSFLNNNPQKLFDFEEFNQKFKYDVIYKDNYIVTVISKFSNKQFIINLNNRNRSYLSMIYNANGTLKKPLKGMVSPIIELHPVVSESNAGYDLYAVQRVIGYYNADTLGMIITPLHWNGSEFAVINNNPYLTLAGSDIKYQ